MKTDEQLREEAKIIARELFNNYATYVVMWTDCKQCALIAVNKILELLPEFSLDYQIQVEYRCYTLVKEELEKL